MRARRILELVLVLAAVAATVLYLKPGDPLPGVSSPSPVESPAPSSALPRFTCDGVRVGMSQEGVVKLLGPSKGDRYNENRQRYLNFGDIDVMFSEGKVSVISCPRVRVDERDSVHAGSQRSDIQRALGKPFVPGPEPGPHRAPDYEFYRGADCLVEVAYTGDEATLFTLYPDY